MKIDLTKYKAWDKINKKMYTVGALDLVNKLAQIAVVDNHGYCYKEEWTAFENIILMQYTGTNDKNSKELYRGDIVKWRFKRYWRTDYHIGKIIWSKRWHCYYLADLDKDYLIYRMRDDIEYEKIGDIHTYRKCLGLLKEVSCRENGTNSNIKFNILSDDEMMELGFTDYGKLNWFYSKNIYHKKICREFAFDVTFNVTIPKNLNDSEFRIDVLDENICQPYDYQRLLRDDPNHEMANIIRNEVEKQMEYLQTKNVLSGHEYGEYI